jgi:hypothetical protein
MKNFDLKNFLVENKLTANSKQLQEYEMEKVGESTMYAFKTEKGALVKIAAENLPKYINGEMERNGNKPVTLTFTKKVETAPDYKITGHTDDMGRPMNV